MAGVLPGLGEDSDADVPDIPQLPDGIKKEVLREGEGFRTPQPGDDVTVHYVGTLAADGSEFDSSRSRDQPFVFALGKEQVIKGWDLGVATMRKGELAKFTLEPEYAYGEQGSPPKIPENATLVFEIELISWASKDDLFGDGGVIKTELEEGKGWKNPRTGEEVMIDVKVSAKDGSVIEDRSGLEYSLGSEALGDVGRAVDQALQTMKRGDRVALKCSKEYAYGDKHPDGVKVELTLREVFDVKDVSFLLDGTVMKKMVQEADGYDMIQDSCTVKLEVSAATDGTESLPGFKPVTLDFTLGNGEVCDALESAVLQMKRGERAIINCSGALAACAALGLQDLQAKQVLLTVEVLEASKVKEVWEMTAEEKVEHGAARKDVGTALFKAGRLALALQRYEKVSQLFSYMDNMSEENKAKGKALKQACEANLAMVQLKLGNWEKAREACEVVLKEDRLNVKAIYRRAQAQLQLKNFAECMADCRQVVELDPSNKEARALLKEAQAGQKQEDKKAKGLFANMCKALGKGPIPEPAKEQQPELSDSEEDPEPLGVPGLEAAAAAAGESK